jgi:hypothetical protein
MYLRLTGWALLRGLAGSFFRRTPLAIIAGLPYDGFSQIRWLGASVLRVATRNSQRFQRA